MIITDAIPNPTFANHESFHLRYGWLKKAYDRVRDDRRVFARDDITVQLGVGKNMVRSIKFWSIANKIINANGHGKNITWEPTYMGRVIFGKKGLDPYLEKPDTLWLLHWMLFAPPCRIPVWWLMMNEFSATNIKLEEATEAIAARVTNIPEWSTPSINSVKKDIDVFIHTYSTRQDKLSIEDYLDCPFRQLHMIKQSSRDTMRFVFGKKNGLSPLIVAFACLDFIVKSGISSKSVSVSRLATETGSVGHIFKINENELAEMLHEASNMSKSIKISNVNSIPHLTFKSAEKAYMDVLYLAYDKKLHLNKNPKMEQLIQ